MRSVKTLLVVVLFGGAGLAGLGAACGGSSDVKDAGPDVTTDTGTPDTGPADTGVKDTGVKDAGCDANIDLLDASVPDATLDGGINVGACYGCLRSACMSVLQMCNMDCACKEGIVELLGCLQMSGDLQGCISSSSLDTSYILALAGCGGGCASTCGVSTDASLDAPDGG